MEETRQKHKVETQETADPNTAIPLHYASLDPSWVPNINSNSTSSGSVSPNQISVIKRSTLPRGTWHMLSKTLLLKKAAVVYLALAEKDATDGKYGQALRNITHALVCFCEYLYRLLRKFLSHQTLRLMIQIYLLLRNGQRMSSFIL